jgi:hypothetical protein
MPSFFFDAKLAVDSSRGLPLGAVPLNTVHKDNDQGVVGHYCEICGVRTEKVRPRQLPHRHHRTCSECGAMILRRNGKVNQAWLPCGPCAHARITQENNGPLGPPSNISELKSSVEEHVQEEETNSYEGGVHPSSSIALIGMWCREEETGPTHPDTARFHAVQNSVHSDVRVFCVANGRQESTPNQLMTDVRFTESWHSTRKRRNTEAALGTTTSYGANIICVDHFWTPAIYFKRSIPLPKNGYGDTWFSTSNFLRPRRRNSDSAKRQEWPGSQNVRGQDRRAAK